MDACRHHRHRSGGARARLLEFYLGGTKLIEAVAHFDADVIKAQSASARRSRRVSDLDQQQLVMRPARRERCRLAVEDPAHFAKAQEIAIKSERLLEILHIEHHVIE